MTRYELTVPVLTSSPLHSGSIDEVVDRDRPKEEREAVPRGFARDGLGRPVLTGRSVKGALRAACSRYLRTTGEDLAQLWGGVEGPASTASALTFHTVDLGEALGAGRERNAPELPTRTGIAVDRYWGTAGDTALFAHEYVPDGRPLTLRISAQAGRAAPPGQTQAGNTADPEQARAGRAVEPEQVERLFAVILGLIQAEQVAFGGRRNAGWGRVRLDPDRPWEIRRSSLGSREGLLEWLDGGEEITSRVEPVEITSPTVRISITWDSPTGILVAEPPPRQDQQQESPAPADAGQTAPEGETEAKPTPTRPLRTEPDTGELVLPGSSVRGALRSRASRIARTVLAAREVKPADWSELGVHKQLAQDPGLVRDLFGSTEHRGALAVLDTVAASRVSEPWIVTHNAGDRWTGGVAEGALYAEEVHDVDWNSIVLELDLDALSPGNGRTENGRRRAAWCLLGLTLAELAAGTLPLGSRGTRGLGQVRVTALSVDGGEDVIGAPWGLKASEDQAGQSIAAQVLDRLRDLEIEPNPRAGEGWSGWSSYLVDSEEETHDD